MFEDGIISDPEGLGATIKELMSSSDIKGTRVTASVNGLYSLSRIVLVPTPPEATVTEQNVLDAVEEILPLSDEDIYLSWHSIGIGEGNGAGGVEQAVEKALNGRLLDIEDVTKAKGLLIHVSGGEDLTLSEVNRAAEIMKRSLPPKAKVIWGARVDSELQGSVSVMAVVTGVESAFLRKNERRLGPIKLR